MDIPNSDTAKDLLQIACEIQHWDNKQRGALFPENGGPSIFILKKT